MERELLKLIDQFCLYIGDPNADFSYIKSSPTFFEFRKFLSCLVPLEIKSITELHKWTETWEPQIIILRNNCKLKKIDEFNSEKGWKSYNGINIYYLIS